MLKSFELNKLPYKAADYGERLVRYTHLYPFKQQSPYEIIKLNDTLQVVVALLINENNPEFPIKISIPTGLTDIEILNLFTLQMLPNIFKDYRFIASGKNIKAVQIKGLRDEAIESFQKLKDQNKIDQCLLTLLRSDEKKELDTETVKAFEFFDNENTIKQSDDINQILSNKFFMYLIIEALRDSSGMFGLPFHGWKKNEIENQDYFRQLKMVFNKVFFLGNGEDWGSTHLIVAEPSKRILKFIIE